MQKVSIIIPVFNGEEYLEECLESIINQTFKNIEIIVINDGSIDGSEKIIDKYKEKDNRIISISTKNGGVGSARNKGIEMSTSEWIMFVDCDDILEKDAVEQYMKIEDKSIDLIISKTYVMKDAKKETASCRYKDDRYFNKQEKDELLNSIFYDNYEEKISYISCVFSKLYKKQLLVKSNIKFNTELKYGEDGLFNLKAIINSKKIAFLNVPTYNYRLNIKSVMRKFNPTFIENHTQMLDVYKKYLKDENLENIYKNEYDYFVLRQLNKYLKYYFFRKENPNSKQDLKQELSKLINIEPYCSAINCKINNLHFKRKVMKFLLKRKQLFLLKKIYEIGAVI